MMCKTTTKVWIVPLLWAGCYQACAEPFAKGPYLGQTPPGSTAQVFAPGLICDTRPRQWESHGTFSADGNTFCFARGRGVVITENTNQGWTAPKRIESVPDHTWSPCLSPDANSLYFVAPYNRLHRFNLFRCNRTSRGWDMPQKLGPPLSSSACEWSFSLTADNSFYLASSREPKGIWRIPCVNDAWPRAIYVSSVNTRQYNEAHPGIAPDESFMVFNDAFRPGGQGHADLYLTLRNPDGTWSKPRNLGPKINSSYIEFGARISPDKKYLFFTRSTGWNLGRATDTADIYWVQLKEYLAEAQTQ
jgi:WD40-like Beta Propeller Repeat